MSSTDEPSSSQVTMTLTDEDIPGAKLQEPLENHAIPALQWWLLCRGIKTPSNWKKAQLIERYVEHSLFSTYYYTDFKMTKRLHAFNNL